MEHEGVIKYQLQVRPSRKYADDCFRHRKTLNGWRGIMFQLKLIGQDPTRYQGAGFGNISYRLVPRARPKNKINQALFVISGTQTGHLYNLSRNDLSLVVEADPAANRLVSEGPAKPSSEALTHAAIYHVNPEIIWVIHVHSPDIWQHTRQLNIPFIDSDIAYGTPEMAEATARLISSTNIADERIFSMLGHEDGVICFGATAEQAALPIVKYLALAKKLE